MWNPLCVGRRLSLCAAHSFLEIDRGLRRAYDPTNTRRAVFAACVVSGISDVLEGITLVIGYGDDDDMVLKQSYTQCFCRGQMPTR